MNSLHNPVVGKPGLAMRRMPRCNWRVAIASLAVSLLLNACGGGDVRLAGNFRVDILVGGKFVSETPVAPGGSLNVAIRAGQSLKLDAGEPVV